mmetsp:Transcript_11004/g.21561  ORF Transcript_11004/g.21561 Transcript_11004/m.21561 type:complete len:183 (+) Transcript_11004:200-748(+)
MRALLAYHSAMKVKPILTLSSITAARMGLGFAISEAMKLSADPDKTLDQSVLLGHTAYGAGLGVCLYVWLIKVLPGLFPGPLTPVSLFTKVVFDQAIMGSFLMASYLYASSLMTGLVHQQAVERTKSNFLPTFTTGAIVWFPTSFINFYLVKPLFQPLLLNAVALSWNIYLAYKFTHPSKSA